MIRSSQRPGASTSAGVGSVSGCRPQRRQSFLPGPFENTADELRSPLHLGRDRDRAPPAIRHCDRRFPGPPDGVATLRPTPFVPQEPVPGPLQYMVDITEKGGGDRRQLVRDPPSLGREIAAEERFGIAERSVGATRDPTGRDPGAGRPGRRCRRPSPGPAPSSGPGGARPHGVGSPRRGSSSRVGTPTAGPRHRAGSSPGRTLQRWPAPPAESR